jgi:PiT family inorganic phosphate transporter
MVSVPLFLFVTTVAVALVFDFFNGFHDAANSIATVVSTRVLSPGLAVVWAAFFNFIAAFIFPLKVATTIGKGLVVPAAATEYVILAGLIGAIAWDIITWYFGLPTSSSHALIGGFAGAAIAKVGFGAIIYSGWTKTIASMFISPVIGLIMGFLLMIGVAWLFRDSLPGRVDKLFRKLQLVSAGLYRRWGSSRSWRSPTRSRLVATPPTFTSHSGRSSRATRRWRLAPFRGDGGSSRRWARRSPSSSRSAVSAPRPRRR